MVALSVGNYTTADNNVSIMDLLVGILKTVHQASVNLREFAGTTSDAVKAVEH